MDRMVHAAFDEWKDGVVFQHPKSQMLRIRDLGRPESLRDLSAPESHPKSAR